MLGAIKYMAHIQARRFKNFQNKTWLSISIAVLLFPVGLYAHDNINLTNTSALNRTLTIKQFINHVWQTNPDVQTSQEQIESAQAQLRQSRRPIYNPVLGFDYEHISQSPHEERYALGLSQTIDFFNKRGANAKVGHYNLIKAKAKLKQLKLSLATRTLQALAEYQAAQKLLSISKQRVILLNKFNMLNSRKFQSGDIAHVTLDQSALAYAQSIAQRANAEVAKATAWQKIAAIVPSSAKFWPHLVGRLPTPIKYSKTKQQNLIHNLPKIQIFNAQIALARSMIKVALTQTKSDPTFNFNGGSDTKKLLLGLGLNMPLFVRNNYKDLVTSANHQAIAAEHARKNTYIKAMALLKADVSRYGSLYLGVIQWHQAADHSLKDGVNLLNKLWQAGELSTTDYLVKLKQRLDSQVAGVKLKGNAWRMWFAIMSSSGQLDHWLVKQKNKWS